MRSTFAVRETASLGQQMLNAPFGINGLNWEECDRTDNFILFINKMNLIKIKFKENKFRCICKISVRESYTYASKIPIQFTGFFFCIHKEDIFLMVYIHVYTYTYIYMHIYTPEYGLFTPISIHPRIFHPKIGKIFTPFNIFTAGFFTPRIIHP